MDPRGCKAWNQGHGCVESHLSKSIRRALWIHQAWLCGMRHPVYNAVAAEADVESLRQIFLDLVLKA